MEGTLENPTNTNSKLYSLTFVAMLCSNTNCREVDARHVQLVLRTKLKQNNKMFYPLNFTCFHFKGFNDF